MNISELKPKETPVPPKYGEVQFSKHPHLCEDCGHYWGLLRWNGEKWICERCWEKVGRMEL